MNDQTASGASKPGKGFLIASGLCAIVFIANVVIGKISISQGATEVTGLGDIGEFLVLLVAVILFIGACLARERAASGKSAD